VSPASHGVAMPSVPDDTTPSQKSKPTEIHDLPPEAGNDDSDGAVKGGALVQPCFRPPLRGPADRALDPCWRGGPSG
jgi:hypothetical protein